MFNAFSFHFLLFSHLYSREQGYIKKGRDSPTFIYILYDSLS